MSEKKSSIELFLSNRLENLAEALIENIESDRLPPMRPEVILVQSRGMARWLNLHRARRRGIQLNSQYVFPRALIDLLIHAVLPDYQAAEKSAFNRDSLKWFIFENLPSMGQLGRAEPIRHYLEKSGTASPLCAGIYWRKKWLTSLTNTKSIALTCSSSGNPPPPRRPGEPLAGNTCEKRLKMRSPFPAPSGNLG